MIRTLVGSRIEIELHGDAVACLVDAAPGQFDAALVSRDADRGEVVCDATAHPDFAHNPRVTGDPRIRRYAGALLVPLETATGHAIGTVCVLDIEPRPADSAWIASSKLLARQVVERLERQRPEPDADA